MAQFKYTLPSGAEFTLNAPVGTTQVQADRIFYEQVAAGTLVGYEAGQTLTSPATQITKFELSRLDRGTAGVDTSPTLVINQGRLLSVAPSSIQAQSVLATIQALPVPIGIPNLGDVPLIRPVDEADVILAKGDNLAPASIGANGTTALTPYQVQKIQAQIINLVDQPSDEITRDKGLGQYGFNCTSLEQAGYVKMGTSLQYFAADSENFVEVMSSPSVWTGKNGVYSLTDLLNNSDLQNQVQTQLMQQGYDSLLASGTITTVPQPSVGISTGQVYTNTGLQSIGALSAIGLLSAGLGSVNLAARAAENTVASIGRLLNSTNLNLDTIGSGAVNSLSTGLDRLGTLADVNFASLSTGLTNQITGGVGSLIANASKFGGQATALWARSGDLSFSNIGTDLSRIAGTQITNLPGNLNTITGQLTNLVPGSLSNLTGSLDVFGKAGSFATNFANPLGTLNSLPNLGTLTANLSGQFGTLTAGLTNQFGTLTAGLTDQLTGALGSFGSFANLGSIGSLFGGGGDLISGTQVAGGFNNTVNRATVDAAFARVVGSDKIPLPTFQYPSLASLAPRLDIQQAQNFLRNLSSSASTTFGQTVTV